MFFKLFFKLSLLDCLPDVFPPLILLSDSQSLNTTQKLNFLVFIRLLSLFYFQYLDERFSLLIHLACLREAISSFTSRTIFDHITSVFTK
jgi:hypothetical protein